jgi:hypothetical protein
VEVVAKLVEERIMKRGKISAAEPTIITALSHPKDVPLKQQRNVEMRQPRIRR